MAEIPYKTSSFSVWSTESNLQGKFKTLEEDAHFRNYLEVNLAITTDDRIKLPLLSPSHSRDCAQLSLVRQQAAELVTHTSRHPETSQDWQCLSWNIVTTSSGQQLIYTSAAFDWYSYICLRVKKQNLLFIRTKVWKGSEF